jgi:hypothetical protein
MLHADIVRRHADSFISLQTVSCFRVQLKCDGTGDAGAGKWRGNWQMEWVDSTLTLPLSTMYLALLPLMRTPQLPVVDWTDAPPDLNGLVLFAERRNLVSARVPSHFKRSLPKCLPIDYYKPNPEHKIETERERERILWPVVVMVPSVWQCKSQSQNQYVFVWVCCSKRGQKRNEVNLKFRVALTFKTRSQNW